MELKLKVVMELKRINEIDGMRAVAMTMVIAQHCGILPFGWTGVWLFFLISGYVITRNFLNSTEPLNGPFHEYYQFMRRRFFRIVPVYVFFIGVFSIVCVAYGYPENLKILPYLLTFTYNWQMIFDWANLETAMPAMQHLWTISVEEQFYVFYPLLFLFMPARWYKASLWILIGLGPIIRALFYVWLERHNPDPKWIALGGYMASFAQFDAFLLGALIANFEKHLINNPKFVKNLSLITFIASMAYFLAYVLVNRNTGATGMAQFYNIVSGVVVGQGREHIVYIVVDMVAATVLIHGIIGSQITKIFAHPILSYVGRISYGGYLYHGLVLWFVHYYVMKPADMQIPYRPLVFIFVWVVTIFMATLSHRYLEQPILLWSKKVK